MNHHYIERSFRRFRYRGFATITLLVTGSIMGLISTFAQGLEDLVVEKYYVANSVDAADTDGGSLANGSVTYRLFVDMAPGYKIQAVYGDQNHPFILETTTLFFNNTDRGEGLGEKIRSTRIDDNTTAIDSYLSMGASSDGHIAVLKTDDTDGSILGTAGLLTNNDPYAGIALTSADGFISGVPGATTVVGITTDAWFGQVAGNTGPVLTTSNGSWASLTGVQGPDEQNRVMIGQFTTDGDFYYEINVQLLSPNGLAENYVARDRKPEFLEKEFPALINTYAKDIVRPQVSITYPVNNLSYTQGAMTLTVDASDVDGNIDSVEYFLDYQKIGVSTVSPFSLTWDSEIGYYTNLVAVATDDDGARRVSSKVTFSVTESNIAPTVAVTAPINGSFFSPGDIVLIKANAQDSDGTVDSVEFFVNDVKIGTDTGSPYEINWNAEVGDAEIRAIATDNRLVSVESDPVSIYVTANQPPSVSIIAPSEDALFLLGDVITVSAEASDADGQVVFVEFLFNGISETVITESPYTYDWQSSSGTIKIIAIATDDSGDPFSDTVSIRVNEPPTITITSPLDNDTYEESQPVEIVVDARDNDGSIVSVEYLINGTKEAEDTDRPFEFTWTAEKGEAEISVLVTDNDGATDADTVAVTIGSSGIWNDIQDPEQLRVFPNPARGKVFLEILSSGSGDTAKYTLYDLNGKIIMNGTMERTGALYEKELDIEGVEAGFYLLRVLIKDRVLRSNILLR